MPWSRLLRAAASALLPGLGQLLAGRLADAALFAFAATWVGGFLAGQASGDRLLAFFIGAPAIERGFATPIVVFFSVLLLLLRAFAAWAAFRQGEAAAAPAPAGEEKGSGEVRDLAP